MPVEPIRVIQAWAYWAWGSGLGICLVASDGAGVWPLSVVCELLNSDAVRGVGGMVEVVGPCGIGC